jgi:outer membrane protein TolC
MMARYQLGAAAYDDTLQAAQNDRNARIRYLQARTARLADTAALFDAMGELPGETLGKPDF